MLKTTADSSTLYCDRCDRHIATDPAHPAFCCHDGKHYCTGKAGREPIQVFAIDNAIPFNGGHAS